MQEYNLDIQKIHTEENLRLEAYIFLEYFAKSQGTAKDVAAALIHITDLYSADIKKKRGGWSCGFHRSRYRDALRRLIEKKYAQEDLRALFAFARKFTTLGQTAFEEAEPIIRIMLPEILSWRPEPLVLRQDRGE